MGYQDGMGLRPGRTKDKTSADRGGVNSTYSAASGYRAAGAVSPMVRDAPKVDVERGNSALAQFNADAGPKVPKAPGLLQTVGGAVASKVGGNLLEKGVNKVADSYVGRYVDHALSGSSIPFEAIEAANAAEDPIYALGDSQGWWDGASGAANAATNLADPGYIDVLGEWGSGADAASSAAGSSLPGAGPIMAGLNIAGDFARGDTEQIFGDILGGSVVGDIVGAVTDCFITEATMAGLGVQDDNAEPLKVLRFFRDKVLAGTPQGQAMIQEYEAIAPLVVQAVQSRPDAMEIFKALYTQFIAPAVEAVKAQDFPGALQIYAAMIAAVTPFAQEAMDAEDAMEGEMQQASEPQEGPQEAMQQMGQHAGMVAQSPQMAQQAAPQGMMPQGALQQFNADEDYPSSVRFGRR